MANSWVADEYRLAEGGTAVSAPSDEPVSRIFSITAGGATQGLRVDAVISGHSGNADLKFRHRSSPEGDWSDTKSVTVTGNGEFSITFLPQVAGDQAYMPLKHQGQIVADGAGGFTVDQVRVIQPK